MMPPCPNGGLDCEAYQRLVNRGYRLEDRCHARLFAHPARNRTPFVYDNRMDSTPFVYDKKFLKKGLQPNVNRM